MLKLSRSDSYSYPVKGTAVDDDGGRLAFSFTAKFRRVDSDLYENILRASSRYKSLIQAGASIAGLEEECSATDDRQAVPFTLYGIAQFVWVGWVDGVVDEDGDPLEYTDELRDLYLKRQGVPEAILEAWFESVGPKNDLSGARQKNLRAPRGIG
jgi:hypothetical protein